MFDYLEAEAYGLLRYEISRISDEILSNENENEENTDFYNGQKSTLNLILQRMNAIQTALDEALDEEATRIAESELAADESHADQL